MSNVRSFTANNSIDNIPHMLRNLAAEIERGDEPMPRTMFVVCVLDENVPPSLFQFGKELNRLEEIGAFQAMVQRVSQVDPA